MSEALVGVTFSVAVFLLLIYNFFRISCPRTELLSYYEPTNEEASAPTAPNTPSHGHGGERERESRPASGRVGKRVTGVGVTLLAPARPRRHWVRRLEEITQNFSAQRRESHKRTIALAATADWRESAWEIQENGQSGSPFWLKEKVSKTVSSYRLFRLSFKLLDCVYI